MVGPREFIHLFLKSFTADNFDLFYSFTKFNSSLLTLTPLI